MKTYDGSIIRGMTLQKIFGRVGNGAHCNSSHLLQCVLCSWLLDVWRVT